MNPVITAPTAPHVREEWDAMMANPEAREQYFNLHILPIVERHLPYYSRGKSQGSPEELLGQLLKAANELLDDANPEVGDPKAYVNSLLKLRAVGIWREERGNKATYKQLARLSQELEAMGVYDLNHVDDGVLAKLGVTPKRWEQLLSAEKLRTPLTSSRSSAEFRLDMLSHPSHGHDELGLEDKEVFDSFLDQIGGRERAILELRYRDGLTYPEIGELFGVSPSRICQIHSGLIKSFRTSLEESQQSPRSSRGLMSLADIKLPSSVSITNEGRGSAGFLRFKTYVQAGGANSTTAQELSQYVDGPDFFRGLLSKEGNSIEATRRALFRDGAGLDFEAFDADTLAAFHTFARSEGPAVYRSRAICRAIGVPDDQRRSQVVRSRLREVGVFPSFGTGSEGFDRLIADCKPGVRDTFTLQSVLAYSDGPQFFRSFFSPHASALTSLKQKFYRNGNGLDFTQFSDRALNDFTKYVLELWPTAADVSRDKRIAAALGVAQHGGSIALIRERLYQLGVYQRPTTVSGGFNRFVRETKMKKDFPCTWQALAPYVDGPEFFQLFLGEDSSRVIRLFKSRLYREQGAIECDSLPPHVKEAFCAFVRTKYPTSSDVQPDYGLAGILQIRSRSVVPLRTALEKLGVYPSEELDTSGFYRLTEAIAVGEPIRPIWMAIQHYIDSPDFFDNFLSRKNANGLRAFKVQLYERDCPVTKEKLGAGAYEHLVSYIRRRYPTAGDVVRDRALGRVFGISDLGHKRHLVEALVAQGVYSER